MDRPKVIVHNSASVDGRLAVSRDVLLLHGDQRWDSVSRESGGAFEQLQAAHKPQANLEGSGSFVREGDEPGPLVRFEGDPGSLYTDFLPDAIVRCPGHRGWFTVVDSRGRVRWTYKDGAEMGWEGWYLLVLVAHRTPAEYLAYLQRENAPYLVAGQERVDLGLAMAKLKSELGVSCVISSAGGTLNGALLRAGLVDEVSIEYLPGIIGGYDTPSLFDSPELQADEWPTRLELISCQVGPGDRVWVRYRVIGERPGD